MSTNNRDERARYLPDWKERQNAAIAFIDSTEIHD